MFQLLYNKIITLPNAPLYQTKQQTDSDVLKPDTSVIKSTFK